MSGILEGVDQRTQLAGKNRLEILLFKLLGKQKFGINVFKIQEVIHCPPLVHLPKSHPAVRGIANMRGKTIPVIDLSMSIGEPALDTEVGKFVVITEYNRTTQGFLVSAVEQIMNIKWEEVKPPPAGIGHQNYLTAVTKVGEELVEIIDVEKILSEINHIDDSVSEKLTASSEHHVDIPTKILVADDSSVARKQIKRTMDQINMEVVLVNDGKQALETLRGWADQAPKLSDELLLVISDIEMPEMDGYTLTTEIRKDPRMADLHVILHTSLSGVFNSSLVEKVGANLFVPKFDADELAQAVLNHISERKAA